MENNLLSIGEMAKSRNVNVQSLRYYEKLGILCPVYVNPETGYRYYAPEQIMVLEVLQSSADAVEVLLEGSYLCFQEPRERHSAPEDIFPEMLKEREHAAVIISCMTPNAYKYDAVTLEFQIRET